MPSARRCRNGLTCRWLWGATLMLAQTSSRLSRGSSRSQGGSTRGPWHRLGAAWKHRAHAEHTTRQAKA
eukprot:15453721-Alexandrium_andersonii.AAC.1